MESPDVVFGPVVGLTLVLADGPAVGNVAWVGVTVADTITELVAPGNTAAGLEDANVGVDVAEIDSVVFVAVMRPMVAIKTTKQETQFI